MTWQWSKLELTHEPPKKIILVPWKSYSVGAHIYFQDIGRVYATTTGGMAIKNIDGIVVGKYMVGKDPALDVAPLDAEYSSRRQCTMQIYDHNVIKILNPLSIEEMLSSPNEEVRKLGKVKYEGRDKKISYKIIKWLKRKFK